MCPASAKEHKQEAHCAQKGGGALCVQMDFTRTFQANAKCNNINHAWSLLYKILVVLNYRKIASINACY